MEEEERRVGVKDRERAEYDENFYSPISLSTDAAIQIKPNQTELEKPRV